MATSPRDEPALNRRLTLLPVGGLAICFVGLLASGDLNSRPLHLFSLLLLGFGSLGIAVWIYSRFAAPPSTRLLLLVAICLRILAFPLQPSLSNDVQRYLWDGHVITSGENPYRLAPDASELQVLRHDPWDHVWDSLSHRGVETVYPPFAMLVFSIAAASSDLLAVPALYSYKVLLVILDVLGCWALVFLASRHQLESWRTILYLWNPLVILEVAGMGHIDGAGLLPVALVLLFLGKKSATERESRLLTGGAAISAVLGVLVKIVPVVAVPVWLLRSRRRLLFMAVVAAGLLVSLAPIGWSTQGVPPGLVTYGVDWEFNGPLYEPLHRLLRVTQAPEVAKATLSFIKRGIGSTPIDRIYDYMYPQMMAKLLLVALLLAVLIMGRQERDILRATEWALGAALLSAATLYPWYALWVLPWAALRGSWPWLVLSASIVLSYLPRVAGIEYFPWVYALVWGPPALSIVISYAFNRHRSEAASP